MSEKPYDDTLALNVDDLVERIDLGKASLIIIDGGVGEGKTTLAVEIADQLSGHEISLETKNHPQIAMGGEEFLKQLKICYEEKLPCLVYDEAGDFNKRASLTRFNGVLNRTFETFRAFKIVIIIVLPSFDVLDNDLFQKNIPRMLLHLGGRTRNQGNYKGYSLFRMFHIRDKMKKLIVKSDAYKLVRPNFHGHFKNLSKERSEKLDRISTKSKLSELDKGSIKLEGLLTKKEIAQKLGMSEATLYNRLQQIKIQPTRYVNKKAYYKDNVVDIIEKWESNNPDKRRR